jgi:regulator of replication initiation timing
MPSSFDPPNSAMLPDLRQEEAQMRRTLGLEHRPAASSSQYSPRLADRHQQTRRFVRDGEVPVVLIGRRDQAGDGTTSSASPPVNRLAIAENALDAEHAARQRCERALAEAQATVHELQTKIGHADLARDEAVETASHLRAENEQLKAELTAERQTRAEAEQALQKALDGRGYGGRDRVARPAPTLAEAGQTLPRKLGRPLGSKNGVRKTPMKEPKPVRWW